MPTSARDREKWQAYRLLATRYLRVWRWHGHPILTVRGVKVKGQPLQVYASFYVDRRLYIDWAIGGTCTFTFQFERRR